MGGGEEPELRSRTKERENCIVRTTRYRGEYKLLREEKKRRREGRETSIYRDLAPRDPKQRTQRNDTEKLGEGKRKHSLRHKEANRRSGNPKECQTRGCENILGNNNKWQIRGRGSWY